MVQFGKNLKILYLHGLESNQGGPKVDFLSENHMVMAPKLDYKHPDCFHEVGMLVRNNHFDLIIGSSMGGYLAFLLGETFEIPTLLFNPALHSRSFEPVNHFKPNFGNNEVEHTVILGFNDKTIDGGKTIQFLEENNIKYLEYSLNFGHQSPLSIFMTYVNETIEKCQRNLI